MNDVDLIRHGLELARAIDNHQYEVADNGLFFPRQQVMLGGSMRTGVNGADFRIDANIVPAQGIAKVLKAGVGGTTWYIAPFENNTTPQSTLTAATFTGTMGEFTTYSQSTRVGWTIPSDPSSGAYSNSSSPAIFTIGAVDSGGQDIYGAAILSASAKSATTGDLLCCVLFSGARKLYQGDKLSVDYTLSGSST